MKYWFTVSVPVEANNPADVQDLGWEKLIDPDGPADGLLECISTEEPPNTAHWTGVLTVVDGVHPIAPIALDGDGATPS